MSGHNKWSKIKHKKNIKDIKRSKLFSKYISNITTLSKQYGSNIKHNYQLKAAIDNALSINISKDTIHKAINNTQITLNNETVYYEAYGPNGTALIIKTQNINKNKISAEIKYTLNKYGGKLGYNYHLFKKQIIIIFNNNKNNINIKKIFDFCVLIKVDDFYIKDNLCYILVNEESLLIIKNKLQNYNIIIIKYKIIMIPINKIILLNDIKNKFDKLLNMLLKLEHVITIFTNTI